MKTPLNNISATQSYLASVRGDKGIWVIIIMLSLISLVAIYSSTNSIAYSLGRSAHFYFFKHLGFVTLGLATLYVCHLIPLGWYRKLAFPCLVLSAILLITTLLKGSTNHQATRSLSTFGISISSAEIVKVAMVLYIAKVIEDRKFETFKDFSIYLMFPIATLTLMLMWGSISAGLLLVGTSFLILLIAGISFKHLYKMIGIYFAGLCLVVFLAHSTPAFKRILTAEQRFLSWVKGEHEEKKGPTQIDYAKMAVASGGIFGKGPGNSTQRYILPESHHDFIYAIIIEEYGIIGGSVVLMLFLWLFFRTILISKKCTRSFSSMLVIGLGLLIALQAILHIGVNVGIMPVTGQTLPLVSLGGTSFIAVSAAFGMILAVSRTLEKDQTNKEYVL